MKITLAHGSGGKATSELIHTVFAKQFQNKILNQMEDAAVVTGAPRIAVTTDSFVVTPLFFKGGDIGKLAVCGTVNDLLMRGAVPKYITSSFILEEGADTDTLERIAGSMAQTAAQAGVQIVAGDTKVIEGNGGIYINTAGVGFIKMSTDITSRNLSPGDAIIVSGAIGDHHAAILSARMNIENAIVSDCAPLNEMVQKMLKSGIHLHTLRDVTRGGLGTVLCELADASGWGVRIYEKQLPVHDEVSAFAKILGLNVLHMGNEGKLVAVMPAREAQQAVQIIRSCSYGREAAVIGEVTETKGVRMCTALGGERQIDVLYGEGLPRIC